MEQIKYKKSLGQNFLYDQKVLEKIYNSINPNYKDLIIEIGPGSGNLTKWLQKYNSQIIAFELDESLKPKLDKIKNEHTKFIYNDFLKVDILKEISNYKYENLYVIANIPYYITTPIITKIINEKINPKSIILMVQKEVAERLCAKPGCKDYGFITVFLNYFYSIDKLFDVSKTSFYPVPKVDSSVIKLTNKTNESIDLTKFDTFLQHAFAQKRKTLRNNLKMYDELIIDKILKKYNYSLNNRAEEIPLEVYIDIIKSI